MTSKAKFGAMGEKLKMSLIPATPMKKIECMGGGLPDTEDDKLSPLPATFM